MNFNQEKLHELLESESIDADDKLECLLWLGWFVSQIEAKPVKKNCKSCLFFVDGVCKKAGATPPDHVQLTGCELFENNIDVPF